MVCAKDRNNGWQKIIAPEIETRRDWHTEIGDKNMQNTRQLPFYHPDSEALPSQCSPLSPPSSAGRCRSAGQWLARHSGPCTPRAHQSRASCCPRSLPPGRKRHRISASAWLGCQSPCSWRRLALPRRSTCLAAGEKTGSSSTDA